MTPEALIASAATSGESGASFLGSIFDKLKKSKGDTTPKKDWTQPQFAPLSQTYFGQPNNYQAITMDDYLRAVGQAYGLPQNNFRGY